MKRLLYYIKKTFNVSYNSAKLILLQLLVDAKIHEIKDKKARNLKIKLIVDRLNDYFAFIVASVESDMFHKSHSMSNNEIISSLTQIIQKS